MRRRTPDTKYVICWISDFSPEYPGSFIEGVSALAKQCRNAFELEMFCIFPDTAKGKIWLRALDAEKIRYGFVSRRLNSVTKVRSLLGEYRPVLFHSHFFLYDLAVVFLKLIFYRNAKIVWHYHNPTGLAWLQRIKNLVKFRIVGRYLIDRCIAVGDGVYQSLVAACFPAPKLVLIHNGINTQRYVPNRFQRIQSRRSLGVQEDQTLFLLLGLDPVRKGVDIFIRAAAETLKESAECRFIIVGRKETRDFVSKLDESALLGASLLIVEPQPEFGVVLNAIDVLVSCSRSEAFSYAIAEAMSAEKHVICSDAPGMREIYGGASGVWFFSTENWLDLAALMRRATKLNEPERSKLGQGNRALIRAQYSLDLWVEKMVQLYGTLIYEKARIKSPLGKRLA